MMRDFKGKVAVVTGAASGIGLALAEELVSEGAHVVLADIDGVSASREADRLASDGASVLSIALDVSSRSEVVAAKAKVLEKFGKVHIVCNNAGVGVTGRLTGIPEEDWPWLFGINVMGVVHGMETFAPVMIAQGEGGYFVNTASMAGIVHPPTFEPYCGTKAAVVAMSEGWAVQLEEHSIGLSILCPGAVNTRIYDSHRHRSNPRPSDTDVQVAISQGLDPRAVASMVMDSIRTGRRYIFPHPEYKDSVEQRFRTILLEMSAFA